jgi:autophagy-related protein 2
MINSVEILDKLRSSQFNKMMYLYTTPQRPKQTHANMIMIKAAHMRPDPQLNIEECCLKISVLPIRLNIDQDALLFVYQFFSELTTKSDSEGEPLILNLKESLSS